MDICHEFLYNINEWKYMFGFISRFSSCHDLMLSRFCATDYRDLGILGVKVNRITRVHNRILKTRFEESLIEMTEDEDNYFLPTR